MTDTCAVCGATGVHHDISRHVAATLDTLDVRGIVAAPPAPPEAFSFDTLQASMEEANRLRPPTASVAWVRSEIARFTYKPGWRFEALAVPGPLSGGGVQVRAFMTVEDTHQPGRMIEVFNVMHLSDYELAGRPAEWFAKRLANLIKDMEVHESREWLRRDGEILDNPHNPRVWGLR